MTTVAQTIDRIYRTFLEPPDEQPAEAVLSGTLSTAGTSLTIASFQTPDDEELLRQGVILEIDSELIKVSDYDPNTNVATLAERGFRSTTVAEHADGSPIRLSPIFPRLSVFEAFVENVNSLGADLYTVRTEYVSFSNGVGPVSGNAVSLVRIRPEAYGSTTVHGELVDYHPQVGGRAVVCTNWQIGGAYVTYRQRMTAPTSEEDTLAECGIETEWVLPIVLGVSADLLVGRDLSKTHTEWISAVMETEAIRLGTRTQIAVQLRQYRNIVLDGMRREMDQEYRPTVRFRNPFGVSP